MGDKPKDKELGRKFTSKRAAEERANSVLKRAYGAGEIAIRGLLKTKLYPGSK